MELFGGILLQGLRNKNSLLSSVPEKSMCKWLKQGPGQIKTALYLSKPGLITMIYLAGDLDNYRAESERALKLCTAFSTHA